MLTVVDYVVLGVYLVGVAALGIYASGRQRNATDYFLGGRDMPWYAVTFSIVATETSTLTVIGTPAIAYFGALTFLQLTFGYLIGRTIVALLFLPRYFEGNLSTAYAFLGERFGQGMRTTASVTFLGTRLLADGVRLFATAIPIKVIADSVGFPVSYFQIIGVIGIITIIYTYIGGIKAVVWMDVVQMGIYVGGAIWAVFLLLGEVPANWLQVAEGEGKTRLIWTGFELSISEWFTHPYTLLAGVLAGTIFSMASHGTDQLIVQRVLTCRNLRDARKALITSGVVVIFQFALFLFIGLLLWSHYGGASLADLGLTRGDELFPRYVIEGLPPGVSGLILAGIIAAAMSTLSSSLNSLASSTMLDLYQRLAAKPLNEKLELRMGRVFTMFWGLIFIVFANMFRDQQNPVIEIGLAIAGFTYGGLLGAFLLGLLNKRVRQLDALISFFAALLFMIFVIFGVWLTADGNWIFTFFPSPEMRQELALRSIAWPWYPVIGSTVMIVIGSLLALRHPRT